MPLSLHRKKSPSAAAAQGKTEWIAYRENGEVKYAPVHTTVQTTTNTVHDNDSTAPLVVARTALEPVDASDESLQHFTATGRPITQATKSNQVVTGGLSQMGAEFFVSGPARLLPPKFTDDSIIPVVVTNLARPAEETAVPAKKSLLDKMRRTSTAKRNLKVVYMPRREYLKHFARDENSLYIGSEPEHQWTDEELQATFGQYQPQQKPT